MKIRVDNFEQVVEGIQQDILNEIKRQYSEKTVELLMNPKNVGKIEHPNGHAKLRGTCGDSIEIFLKIDNDDNIIDAKFLTDGCGATVACGSAITELVIGKNLKDVLKIAPYDVIKFLNGLPESSIHCAILAVNTLHAAIARYLRT